MPSNKPLAVFVAAFSLILGSLAIATPLFAASSEKVLYNFCSADHCTDGSGPLSGLIFDKDGNLYGTTYNGGAGKGCEAGCGTVFELIPSNGKWTEKVLHSFYPNGGGNLPSADLILDSAGNLYGTTLLGDNSGPGVVFELIRDNGKWTEKVLDIPGDSTAALIFDPSGNLYGTVLDAAAFELIPNHGKWTEKVLYSFTGKHDGYFLYAPMIFDLAGNLYGTAYYGGAYGYGDVFELIPNNGKWTEKVLHSFNYNGKDGASPYAGLILDSAGNLYGTTEEGGTGTGCYRGCGTVFKLIPGKNGAWTRKILHNFNLDGVDGVDPIGGLIFDKNGNLYGTTASGGANGVGTVYELTPGNGKWTEKVLHAFNGKDGAGPWAGLVMDKAGHLYGTTAEGGTHMDGVVFEITP